MEKKAPAEKTSAGEAVVGTVKNWSHVTENRKSMQKVETGRSLQNFQFGRDASICSVASAKSTHESRERNTQRWVNEMVLKQSQQQLV